MPASKKPSAKTAPLEWAVADFLDALALPPVVRRSRELLDTPTRVAEAWRDELLDGYASAFPRLPSRRHTPRFARCL